jgi:hypothetical protein
MDLERRRRLFSYRLALVVLTLSGPAAAAWIVFNDL